MTRCTDAEATLAAQSTVIATVIATAEALLAKDPECGLSEAEVEEWRAFAAGKSASMVAFTAKSAELKG